MKQRAPLISTLALSFAMGLGAFVFMGATPALAGNYGGDGCGGGSGCGAPPPPEDCGCETPPPPPPPPPEDCGCEDDGQGGKIINWNENNNWNENSNTNTNTNTNTNVNTNTNNVIVNVNTSSTASATASAVANANLANDIANGSQSNSGSRSGSRSGGSGFGIGNGNGSGGGGGSYYVAAPAPMSMGVLNVVVREQLVMKPVKGVCVSAKGLEEMALYSTPVRELSPRDEAELFHCLPGDMLVATIGRMIGADNQRSADYTGGYVIECREGEALRYGVNGLSCAPIQSRASRGDAASEGRQGYAEVFIRKNERAETTASAVGAGAATYSGGVGY